MQQTTIHSVSELARRVRRNKSTVSRWLRRDDWPWHPRGPWPATLLPRVLEWAATLQEDRAADWSQADRDALNRECPDLLSPEEMKRVAEFVGVPLRTRQEVATEVARLHALADETDRRSRKRAAGRRGAETPPATDERATVRPVARGARRGAEDE